ncbi:receptor-type tyrosine-protein phosphatase C [Rhinoderma darwinii]|uniref:receptor-type tyrosine-protein phosphatase C n=1 Tax=Rhinoderma darwinii TaxID=43563 RepID=UPI003F67BFC6
MNLCPTLLVFGFLLWDQNHFTLGQISITVQPGTSSPAPHSTISNQNISNDSSRTASNTQSDSNSTDMQASTQSTTMDLTSAFNGTDTTSSNQTTSAPQLTTDVSPSPQGDKTETNCSGIIVKPPLYNGKSETLMIDVPDHLKNKTLYCTNDKSNSSEYEFKLLNVIFYVSMCEPTDITCWFKECTDTEKINILLDVPPKRGIYELKVKENAHGFNFTWNNKDGGNCNVVVESNCSDGERNLPGSEYVDKLEAYTEYNCTSRLLYNGKIIESKTQTLKTKIGKPENIQNLICIPTNTTAKVTWDEPNKANGPLGGYIVTVQSKDPRYYVERNISDLSNLYETFIDLSPYTQYEITIKAYNILELGDKVTRQCMTTEGKPNKVTHVRTKVGVMHNNAVKIECKDPDHINGQKGKFILEINNAEHNKSVCQFFIEGLNYLTTYSYKIYYKNNVFIGDPVIKSITTKYNDKALIGFLAFFITITCVALILVMYKIYKLQKRSSCNFEDDIPLTHQDDEKQLLNIEPIPVEQLLETYKRKNADEGRLFLDEFQSIPRVFSKFPIKEARKSCNQPKNRYIDILPYDENRVVLSEIHGEPGSDYINASYINGFKEPRKYIAAQGPKEETMNDFWRMIWEQKSTIIVMVTRCEEGNRNKCAQYWPSNEDKTEEYGDITVKIKMEKLFPDYITRKLHITNRREKSEREITHIQFTVWPDHGVPDDPNLLLKLRRRVNALSNFFSGPIIIHCSAGVGRTGTYISIDAMLEGLEAESRVDVYGYVVQLRRQRCLMVQVESQYIFIHKSLVEYNQFGETEISTADFPHLLNNMKKSDLPSEPSQLNFEFQRLPSYKNWRPQTVGNHQDNKDKNRNSSVVPYEFNRVQVRVNDEPEGEHTEDSEMSSDEDSDSEDSIYINASYIIGYWGNRTIVAAQAPLKNTLSEFWRMIFQKKIKSIVVLSGPNQENDEGECAPYWKEQSKTYADLEVELSAENPCHSYTERSFEIRHTKRKDVRKVSQFHYNQWGDVLPKETKSLLEMIEKVRKTFSCKRLEEQSSHDKSVPLLVHCSDGSQRTGTFCALWNLLESAQVEEVIDVFQTVKRLRRQRSGMVSSFEQYEFLYDTLASTVPAQNGQVTITIHQDDKPDIKNEMKNKTPEEQAITATLKEDSPPKPKQDETVSNGPSAAVFTDVSLRIDE